MSSKSVLEVLKWCKSLFVGSKAVPKISVAIAALEDIHYALKPERLLRDPRDLSTRIRLPYQGNNERRSAIVTSLSADLVDSGPPPPFRLLSTLLCFRHWPFRLLWIFMVQRDWFLHRHLKLHQVWFFFLKIDWLNHRH